jgi:hypothetical protein
MGLLDDAIREHLELKRRRGADATEVSRQESDALGPVRRTPEGQPDLSDLPDLPGAPPADEPELEPDEGAGAHEVPAAPAPWEEQTTVHAATPEPDYEPPPIPPVAAAPPTAPAYEPPAAYEPPPVPTPPQPIYEPEPEPEPDFDPFPELADEPPIEAPPAEERGSLLSRFKRRREAEPDPDQTDPPTAAHEPEQAHDVYEPPPPPPPAAYEPPPVPPPVQEPDIVPADEEPEGEDLLEETPDFLEETPEHDRLWFEQRPPRDFDFDG